MACIYVFCAVTQMLSLLLCRYIASRYMQSVGTFLFANHFYSFALKFYKTCEREVSVLYYRFSTAYVKSLAVCGLIVRNCDVVKNVLICSCVLSCFRLQNVWCKLTGMVSLLRCVCVRACMCACVRVCGVCVWVL